MYRGYTVNVLGKHPRLFRENSPFTQAKDQVTPDPFAFKQKPRGGVGYSLFRLKSFFRPNRFRLDSRSWPISHSWLSSRPRLNIRDAHRIMKSRMGPGNKALFSRPAVTYIQKSIFFAGSHILKNRISVNGY